MCGDKGTCAGCGGDDDNTPAVEPQEGAETTPEVAPEAAEADKPAE